MNNSIYKVLITFITFCVLLSLQVSLNDGKFTPIVLMPLSLLFLLIFNCPFKNNISHISIITMSIVFTLRYALYPVVILFNEQLHSLAYDTEVILLMVYELIGSHLVIALFADKLKTSNSKDKSKSLGVVAVGLMIIGLACVAISPSLLVKFSLSSGVDKTSETIGTIHTLFNMGIWVTIVFVLIQLSYRNPFNKSKSYYFNAFLASLICIYYLLFNVISGSNVKRGKIIIGCIALGYLFFELFPRNKKRNAIIIAICGTLGVFLGTFFKFDTEVGVNAFLNDYLLSVGSLDEYFAGIMNINYGLSAINAYPKSQTLISTLTDFFYGMPFVSSLFPEGANNSLATFFHLYTGRTDNICPLIVQSIAHFGKIGAPIMSMIMTYLAIKFNIIRNQTTSLYVAFVCTEVLFYCSLFMCMNTVIIFGVMWVRILFILFMKLDESLKVRIKLFS